MRPSHRPNSFDLSLVLAVLSISTAAARGEPPTPLAPPSDQPRKSAAPRYQTGMALLNRGLNDAAEKELRAFLGEDPAPKDAANARYALAIALSRQSRFEESAAQWKALLDIALSHGQRQRLARVAPALDVALQEL